MNPRCVGAVTQVQALVRLRSARATGRTVLGLLGIPVLLFAAAPLGTLLPGAGADSALVLLPTAWLAFAVTVLVAAAAGGTRALLPPEAAVAFPVSPAAENLGSLLLAPLNAAWMTQAVCLLALGGWSFAGGDLSPALLPGLAMTALWIIASTCLAQLAGWAVELLRSTPVGGWLLRAAVTVAVRAGAGLAITGSWGPVLDESPTVLLVAAALQWSTGWALAAAALVVAAAGGVLLGGPLVARVQRRPPRETARVEARTYPARAQPTSALGSALRVDRAGVWRSAPLRRGLLTLAVVPGAAAALTGLGWPMLPLLPGLVTSGAALLFGVNAFCLDGPGSLWRSTLPGGSREWLLARLLVLAEICTGAAVLAVLLGTLRTARAPTTGELVAVLAALLAGTTQVLARCARWSVHRPYPATLRDPRDQPAPPAAMADYSARLAIGTTTTGVLLTVCAQHDLAVLAAGIGVGVACWSARHLVAALRAWEDDAARSRVVVAVSAC